MTDNLGTLITSIAALIGSIVVIYKLSKIERPSNDADLVGRYQAIARLEADNSAVLKRRIDELEQRLDNVEANWAEAEQYISSLDEWANEVLAVMRTLNVAPVHPKPQRRQRAQPSV